MGSKHNNVARLCFAIAGLSLPGGALAYAGAANAVDSKGTNGAALVQFQGLGGIIDRVRTRKGTINGASTREMASQPDLQGPQKEAYDKLVAAANMAASAAFWHKRPEDVQSYGGGKDSFKDPRELGLVVRKIKECQDAAAAALTAEISGLTLVNFNSMGSSLIRPTPLKDMSEKVCGKLSSSPKRPGTVISSGPSPSATVSWMC